MLRARAMHRDAAHKMTQELVILVTFIPIYDLDEI